MWRFQPREETIPVTVLVSNFQSPNENHVKSDTNWTEANLREISKVNDNKNCQIQNETQFSNAMLMAVIIVKLYTSVNRLSGPMK